MTKVIESEFNNSFDTRQFLSSDAGTVYGQLSYNDIDFFTISGLNPGTLFTAEITSESVDPLLGLVDNSGNILAINDDQADDSVLPVITGIVPTDGSLNFAITGLRDTKLIGDHFEFGSYTLSFDTFTLPKSYPHLTVINGGFENGDFTGWTTLGATSIETATFNSGPSEGSSQALLSTGGVTFSDAIIETFLGLETGSLDNFGNGDVTQGSAIRQIFTANAGDILTFDWSLLTNESAQVFPNNDFFFVSISSESELADTKFSSLVTSSTTEFFAETGLQTFSFTIPTTGTYTLGLGVADVGDNTVDSGLLIDNVTLTSVCNYGVSTGSNCWC
ncbi:MAG: hypothetical protein KME28_03985 [Pelatocladus maniniholoensis HA4357-MV3]|jgi:hypothetical protein|uniref:Uncharacterized protein n=1 Tax=Pelatocladus maniniholoensis HA4357-MV3 TaxID=1117104 RepID=A0A9E3H4H9_9NOST|nr:hypothetical protein [Pelatocladus maniniholoensis HA4357-MV3]BAZ70785.1 peptidase domain-containing protein [Fischerella sp. NIES-4106]